jgi:peptide/nickel transport system substrate-binding protein
MRKKWLYLLMLAALVVPLILTACAATEAPPEPTAPPEEPKEEPAAPTEAPEAEPPVAAEGPYEGVDPSGQEVLYWHQHTRARQEGLDEMVAEFNDTNEWGIQVNAEYAGGYPEIYDKMIAAISADDPTLLPNLTVAYANAAAKYQLSDSLVDMDEFIESAKWGLTEEEFNDFPAGLFESDVSPIFGDGHFRMGYPPNRSMEMLYYNLDWLNELGYDGPPETWAEFKEMACAATDPDAGTVGYEISIDASRMASMVFSRHGTYFAPDGSAFDYTNDTFMETMRFIKELYDEGCATLIAEAYGDQTDFGNYKTLFTISSSSGLNYYDAAVQAGEQGEFQWGVAALPYMDGGDQPVMNLYGASVSVPKTTPEQELAAWLFVKWLTEPENQARWAKISGYFPTRVSTADLLADYFVENPTYKQGFDLLPYSTYEAQWCPCYEEVRRLMRDAYSEILDGADIDATLAQLTEDANGSLAENLPGGVLPVPDLWGQVQVAGKLVVSTDPNYAPQSFLNDDGELDGFDIDVSKEVADRLGVDVEFVTPDWDTITPGNWGGRWDISIGSMTPTEQRAEVLYFTDEYYYTPAAFAVHNDNTDITSVDDLSGKKVGVGSATTYESWLAGELAMLGGEVVYDAPSGVDVNPYTTDMEAVEDLALGDGTRLDAVMSAVPTLQNAMEEGIPIKYLGIPAFYEPLAFALDRARGPSDKMVEELNGILADMHEDGTLTELSLKWYGVDITTIVTEEEAPPEAAAPAEEGVIVVGTTDKVTVLDPADSYDFHTWQVHRSTMDTLLHYIPGTTSLELGLATGYEASDDGMEYTFTLVEGVSFPDGTPFNAEAVKWSYDRVVRLEGDPNWLVTSFVEDVEVVDEYTVKYKLLSPVSYWPLLVATQPYSPVSPNCYSEDAIDADSMCSGVGPYTITSWDRDVEMVLEAYDGYPGEPPKTPKIIIKYYADPTTMRLAVESGEIDIAGKTLNPTDYADLEAAGELQVIEGPGAYIRYICFNVTTPPFDSQEVRQAIAYAVDRDAVVSIAYQGTHQNLFSMVPIGMWSHIDAFPERDVDKAVEMLEAEGYSADNKLVMDLWWTPTHYGPTEADVATVLKDNLEETGLIEVNLQNTEWATYKEYQNAGSMPVFLLGWYPDYLDPDNYTWSWGHSSASDDMGIFYANDEMDALLEAGQVATPVDSDERKQIYEDAQELWVVDPPTIPLSQGSLLVVAQPDITGIVLDPTMYDYYFLYERE